MKKSVLLAASFLVSTAAFAADAPAKPAAAPAAKPAAPATPAAPAAAKKDAPAAAAPAAAVPAAEAGPPPPAAELAANLKVFEGKWKCDGKTPDTVYTKAHPIKAEMTWKKDLNGYWVSMRYEEKKTKENPTPYVMATFTGFDPSKKQLVRTDLDGMGMITHLTSKGWEGSTLVWAGETGGGQKIAFKETVTQKSPKEITSVLEMGGPDGKLIVIGESTCKK